MKYALVAVVPSILVLWLVYCQYSYGLGSTLVSFQKVIGLQQDRNHSAQNVTEVLFFNRVPKTGSEMTVLLLQWLQGINKFRLVRLKNFIERRLTPEEENEMQEEVLDYTLSNAAAPVAFDRHVYFTDFQPALMPYMNITYFSMVRDPVEKFVSRFYYDRATPSPNIILPANVTTPPRKKFKFVNVVACIQSHDPECSFITDRHYDLTIPYFCGNEDFCTKLNSQKALKKALENVDKYYPVVGVLEELNCTLRVLEKKLPTFFSNVQDMYFSELSEPKKNKNVKRPRVLPDNLRTMLQRNLSTEYKFYNSMKFRLKTQCLNL